MKLNLQKVFLISIIGILSNYANAQEYNSFEVRYSQNLRGDLTFIGNNILNRDSGTSGEGPLDPYNNLLSNNSWSGANNDFSGATNYNDYKNMQYIDVDGDPTTFNSSSATLTFPQPDCNLVRYAGLYWSATYPSAAANGSYDGTTYIPNNIPVGTGRQTDFNQIKFRIPGGSYVDITADEIIYDGFTSTDASMRQNSPYACYANVTALVTSLANASGEYTAANIRATTGGLTPGGGAAGGWTLIIVYENPTLSGKLITTFDGFARVNGTNSVDLNYSGFETIPVGPVRASLGAATLEGDFRISGDALSIRANSNPGFTVVSNASNPANNFFNSNITLNGVPLAGRTISNQNTLGYDTDILQLNNPANSVIPNGETAATLRFSTNGDQYFPFFNSFNVEIIEPNIVLEKRVEDIAGNDITGLGVNLGQLLDYVLTFRNLGNDNAVNYTIRDILPINVTLDESSIIMPPGASYTYDPSTRTVVFNIPNNLVEENDPAYDIRMRVKVAENCYDFIDACNNIIENLAYSTYYGEINQAQITDDPSVKDFDVCGYPTPGATNFILDEIEDCDFTFRAQLCAGSVTLDAGNGFDSYTWYRDVNDNRIVDASDIVISDGDPDGDPSTFNITSIGTYIVYKQVADPCKDFNEIFIVEEYGDNIPNPITELINERNGDADPLNDIVSDVVQCSVDGDFLPKIFLCGADDTEFLQLNIPTAQDIVWQQLDESSCAPSGDDCANKNATCMWNDVSIGDSYLVSTAGKYRLLITYQNGCNARFYFNVFQNLLDIDITKRDIVCSTAGNISVTNLGSSYGYQLLDATNDNILVPFSANNGPSFTITTNGAYYVQVAPIDSNTGLPIIGSCIFDTQIIGIIDRQMTVDLTTTLANCNELGSVTLQANGVFPTYDYEIRLTNGSTPQTGSLVEDEILQNDNNFTFNNLNTGDYYAIVRSQDGCEEVIPFTISEVPDLNLFAQTISDISCTNGVVELTASGGFPNPEYAFAIWSINSVNLYTNLTDIPASAYQSLSTFEFTPGQEGTYEFIAVDGNNCFSISNMVSVNLLPPLVITVSNSPVICPGTTSATISINATSGLPPYRYSIDGGNTYQPGANFVNLGSGLYDISVLDASGCEQTTALTITEPEELTASAVISEIEDCNPGLGAEVMIINARGGVLPYTYSFDGGTTFGINNIALLPSGTHSLVLRDASGCELDMNLVVPESLPDPSFTANIDYDCLGNGNITVTASSTDFDYSYLLNGIPNTPIDNPTFNGVSPGTHTITINYEQNGVGPQNNLITETFGAGPNISISEIDPVYCYEPQDGTVRACEPEDPIEINDGEYCVTNNIVLPFPVWRSPNDHTGDPNGRFLAINVGGVAGTNGIIYAKRGVEVLPNNDILISLWAFNIMDANYPTFGDPSIVVELVDDMGNIITSINTGFIPKNTHPDDWHNYTFNLNPGANTHLDIVIRTNSNVIMGNDIAIDDIQAFQLPTTCPRTQDITVVVDSNQAFTTQLISTQNPSCVGAIDGAITFEVNNYDATGFEYTLDNGISWIAATSSPLTTPNTLGAGTYNIRVRKTNDINCEDSFTATLQNPNPITVTANVTTAYTCANGGATITANASGGTPSYQYQLEDTAGNPLPGYDLINNGNNTNFIGLLPGDYVIRVQDLLGCQSTTITPITVLDTNALSFDVSSNGCYSGVNDAEIIVNVTNGNGGYLFRINGGVWRQPTPSTNTTYTYSNLSSGTYTIEVMDALGCTAPAQSVDINPLLYANIIATPISSCNDGSIEVTAFGGDGNYVYAIVPNGVNPNGSFTTSNTLAITAGNDGLYDVYVRDNNGASGYCEYLDSIMISAAVPLSISTISEDPQCHNGSGSLVLSIGAGTAPFEIDLIDLDHAGANNESYTNFLASGFSFYNLPPGNYEVRVRDTFGCEIITNNTINNPDELTAIVTGITPSTCTGNPADFGFEFSGYPTTLGTIEFSADGGATWIGDNSIPGTTDQFTGYVSGTTIYPALRTIDAGGNTVCFETLDPFIIPYPLDDLDISISAIIVNCNELQVTVLGAEGTPNYQYTYSEDPSHFNPLSPINPWTTPATDEFTPHVFTGLFPGRTYVFYVRDAAGCVRQSNVNVNDLITLPLEIVSSYTPACPGDNNATITYTIEDNETPFGNEISWVLYQNVGGIISAVQNSGGPIAFSSPQDVVVTGLSSGTYFLQVQEYDGGMPTCIGATENLFVEELRPLSGNLNPLREIGCTISGLIRVENLTGGDGNYVFDVAGPAGFTPITGTPQNPIEIPSNSPSGNYTVTVTDGMGCNQIIGTVTLNQTSPPIINAVNVSNCSNPPELSVLATGATGALLYSIDGGVSFVNNGGVFSPIAPGTYHIVVVDENGCTATTSSTVYPVLEANVTLTKYLDCTATPDAEVTIEVNNGSGDYEYTVTDSGGTIIPNTSLPSNPYTFSLATADTYTVTVIDINTSTNCSRVFTIEIPVAIDPIFNVTPQDIQCFGADDGRITLNEINTGINPLVFTLSPNLGSFNNASLSFENLPAGIYEVTGTGTNGCFATVNNIVINSPSDINISSVTVNPYECNTSNLSSNASISVGNVTGGSGIYTNYQFYRNGTLVQTGINTSYTEADGLGGTYDIVVWDDAGCSQTTTGLISPYDELLSLNLSETPLSCTNGGESVTLNATGSQTNSATNPSNYAYRILPTGSYQASNTFTNLPIGTYTFEVINLTTSCTMQITHVVEDPNDYTTSVTKNSDALCYGELGSITLDIDSNSYTGGYIWEIFDTNGTPNNPLDDGVAIVVGSSTDTSPTAAIGLPGGNYRVVFRQTAFPECERQSIITIDSPQNPINYTATEEVNVSCTDNGGVILIEAMGGTAPYDITLENINTGSSITANNISQYLFENLGAGTYRITIEDTNGCFEVINNAITLALPNPITATITPDYDLTCPEDSNGILTATINSGGIGNILYILHRYESIGGNILSSSTPQTSNTFNNLPSGFYGVEIRDEGNCGVELYATISDPADVIGSLIKTRPLTCTTMAQLELSVTGGTAPYEYSADNITYYALNELAGANTHVFDNIGPGDYQYYIRDANGCLSRPTNQITEAPIMPLALLVNTDRAVINCAGEATATINASASGGVGNYQFELFTDSSLTLTSRIAGPQTDGVFENLPSGAYYVSVTSADCVVGAQEVIIQEPVPLMVSASQTNISCYGENDGSITVELSGGAGGYQYAISPNLNQFDTINTFTNLSAGIYTVIAQDILGCFEQLEFTITEPATINAEVTITDESCLNASDGTISLVINGGTMPYETMLMSADNPVFVPNQTVFEFLEAGYHQIVIRDAAGCEQVVNYEVGVGVDLSSEISINYNCNNNSPGNSVQISLNNPDLAAEVLYALDSYETNDLQLAATFENLTPGPHFITVAHTNGCIISVPFEVAAIAPLGLTIENNLLNQITAIATGGYGGYTFFFNNVDNGADNTYFINQSGSYNVIVVDALGCTAEAQINMEFVDIEIPDVFTPDGDGLNDLWAPENIQGFPEVLVIIYDRYGRELYRMRSYDLPWDGTYLSSHLPTGDYWYLIKIRGEQDTREVIGHFTLYR